MDAIISIIIATYNAEKTLERCLNSILSQKTIKVELIIIDGGSNDSTVKIIKSFGGDIDYSISEPDMGIYDAWNKGVAISKGKWIMFLGADDFLLPGSLNIYLHILSTTNTERIDIISGQCRYYTKSGRYYKILGCPYKFEVFKHNMLISHGSTLHSRKLFRELGLFDLSYKRCADYDFLLRKQLSGLFIPKTLIGMQAGGASCSYSAVIESYRIKRKHNYSPLYSDLFYLLKGILNLMWEKTCVSILWK